MRITPVARKQLSSVMGPQIGCDGLYALVSDALHEGSERGDRAKVHVQLGKGGQRFSLRGRRRAPLRFEESHPLR